jgi:four helix bundle suffix protein
VSLLNYKKSGATMANNLIPKHGGYRKLKSFQIAQLIYDVTVQFCNRYIDRRSRTHDQMVQAARSGVQNIAEGSQASGTSKKFELKLTSVARASLEELKLDYQDFLRQRNLPKLSPDNPALTRFKKRRCAVLQDVQQWVAEERALQQEHELQEEQGQTRTDTDLHGRPPLSVSVCDSPCQSVCPCSPCSPALDAQLTPTIYLPASASALAANAALALLNLDFYLLERQIDSQANDFEKNGGFTERLYNHRQQYRRNH